MKNFLIYDNNSEQIVARIQAESAQAVCNPYSSIQYKKIEVPVELALADASLDENLQPVLDQALQNARTLSEREAKLDQLRDARSIKLTRCDQLVNIAFLNSWTAGEKTELKNYRLQLLDITEVFKADMSLVDTLNVSAFVWPIEPTEV